VLNTLTEISKQRGKSIAAVALAWLRANPTISTPIASATNLAQLSEVMQELWLTNEEVTLLNTASNSS
jgi:aryl-alcohol dehydrogenase-like predicted oxidoreductase